MGKAKPGISKMLSGMKKKIAEVNDQEICRRLEILMHSEKEDVSTHVIKRLLESPEDFNVKEIPEPYTQYAKHYLYMVKRDKRNQIKEEEQKEGGAVATTARKKRTSRKKTTAKK